MARKAKPTEKTEPDIGNSGNAADTDKAPTADKPLHAAVKTVLADPLLHSLISGMVISAARKQGAKDGLSNSVIAFASRRIARKSMPGAILLGAGFLAKNWYDVRKEKAAKLASETAGQNGAGDSGTDGNRDGGDGGAKDKAALPAPRKKTSAEDTGKA